MILLNMCGGGGDMFSEKPAGAHWAEFWSSFFFTGCFAIPILLAITDSIEWGAALTSLAGTLILTGLLGFQIYLKSRSDDGGVNFT